jgi:hypothetical protein
MFDIEHKVDTKTSITRGRFDIILMTQILERVESIYLFQFGRDCILPQRVAVKPVNLKSVVVATRYLYPVFELGHSTRYGLGEIDATQELP